MQEALVVTTSIAVLLFAGIICGWVGKKLRIPDALLLLIAGMLLSHATFRGEPLIEFPKLFLDSLAILTLAMVIFACAARLRLREIDTLGTLALKLSLVNALFALVLFSAAAHYTLGISVLSSLLLSSIVIGTVPEITLGVHYKTRPAEILVLESIFNTPLSVVLPFMFLKLMQTVPEMMGSQILEHIIPFLLNIIVGIGSGIFVGIILFKLIQHTYSHVYSPLAVIIAALLAYVLAENLNGSGVLAVITLGIFFGNVYVKERVKLLEPEGVLTKAFLILLFILTGVIVDIPYTLHFFATSALLFAAFVAIRFIGTSLTLRKHSWHEKLYMTLNAPKGITTIAVGFVLAVYDLPELAIVADLAVAFFLYSIILATITTWVTRQEPPKRKKA